MITTHPYIYPSTTQPCFNLDSLYRTLLFGFTIGQTWIYFWHFWTKDKKALKLFIVFLTIIDTLTTFLTAYLVYWYLILNYGDFAAGNSNKWLLSVLTYIVAISTTSVQLYYARRIYVVSQNLFPALIIVILSFGGNALGFYAASKQLTKDVTVRYQTLIVYGYVPMGETILVDGLITSSMCWALYRKKTGFARTDSVIMTLMAYTVNTGLLTVLLATAATITFITSPNSMTPLVIFWSANKCYINSLLAMLNSRDYVRDRRRTTDCRSDSDNSYNLTSIRVDQPDDPCEPQSRHGNIPVIVHHPTTSGHNFAPTFEIPKLDTSITSSQSQNQSSESSA